MARTLFSLALRIRPEVKPALYGQIYESAEVLTAAYISDLIFSAGIATLGLVLNSPAVVIGAMLISPLMGPILAAGLAIAASDIYLGVKSFMGLVGSVAGAVAFSAILVWQLPFQSPTAEILARTQPNLLDLGVAIFSGLAGSVVVARSSGSAAGAALPGVAIAVALMPPLCAVGFGIGSGWNWQIISGAGLLFLTNMVAIAASAFFVFYMVGMDAPDVRSAISEEEMRHAAGKRIYNLLQTNRTVTRLFGDVGQLRWRILMVAIMILVLYIPLRSSLLQLRDETLSRAAARETVRSLVPADHVLSQQIEILPDRLLQRIVTTSTVDKKRVAEAELALARRVGKAVSIQVRQVANEEELVTLRERLRTPAAPPAPADLSTVGAAIWPLAEEPIQSIWPSESAELAGYEVGFTKESVIVRFGYHSPRPLDAIATETIGNGLRHALKLENLRAVLEWKGVKKPDPEQRK